MFTCSVCGAGESREKQVEEVFRIDGNYALVDRIPATVCTRCGEETFCREPTERIRLMAHGQTKPTKSIPLKVFEFDRKTADSRAP